MSYNCHVSFNPIAYVKNSLIIKREKARRYELYQRGLQGDAGINSSEEVNAEFDNQIMRDKLRNFSKDICSMLGFHREGFRFL